MQPSLVLFALRLDLNTKVNYPDRFNIMNQLRIQNSLTPMMTDLGVRIRAANIGANK